MNHTYLLTWSAHQASYVPVPEFARRRGKSGRVQALSVALLSCVAITAYALPTGGQVSAGQGSIAKTANTMTVTQTSPQLAINWQTFGIGPRDSVNFAQPSASAIALNRVLGADSSQILGRLSANGQVWILNPNGILFGPNSQVNVGSLVASTLTISDGDFLAGSRTFSGSGGSVANRGRITAADEGYVALLGGRISNEGTIQARLGTVALAGGTQVTLDFAGDKLLNVQVDQGAIDALAQNKQFIRTDGGSVLLTARAADAVLTAVVNNDGVIEAHTIDTRNGSIKLLGGMNGGTVRVAGTLDASAPNGDDGGLIETSGAVVKVADGVLITTSAATGDTGRWLIDSPNFAIQNGVNANGKTLSNQLGFTNVLVSGSGGNINVNDSVVWSSPNSLSLSALNSINVARPISNSGTGNVTLRADSTGLCVAGTSSCGSVNFVGLGSVTVNGGAVNIYYNPPGSNSPADASGNGPSYATPTDYSGKVTLNGGSELNAWMLVNDVNQLQAMNTNLGARYALGRAINAAATAGWNSGAGFKSVGSASDQFTGHFDGDGHAISTLTINKPSSSAIGSVMNAGLFGYLNSSGSVSNVGLIGGSVRGDYYVGTLVGTNGGTVNNSYSSAGTVYGEEYAGGLVGSNAGTLTNSSSTGTTVYAEYSSGGLVGSNQGSIATSFSSGSVTGQNQLGGLVGFNSGSISNSYSTGAGSRTAGRLSIGGLVGHNTGSIDNSYSTENASGQSFVGGLVGDNDHGTVSDSYSTGSVVGMSKTGGLIGSSTGQVNASYSSANVTGNDTTRPDIGSVSLGGLVGHNEGTISKSHSSGNVIGTSTLGGLVGFNTASASVSDSYSTGSVTTTNGNSDHEGISAGGLVGVNLGTVGSSHSTGNVAGTLYVGGLVGSSNGAVSGSYSTGDVNGRESVGGLIGDNQQLVSDSHSSSTVTGNRYAGGLIGRTTGDVSNSFSTGSVSGSSFLGGLIGGNFATVARSYSSAAVSGGSVAGGLVGENGGSIANSFSTGAVAGQSFIGGLVGVSFGTSGGDITNSYSSGSVTGTASVGGLVGRLDYATISNGYWNTETSGTTVGVGEVTNGGVAGVTGLTTTQMKQQGSFAGFDFTNVWGINEGVSYPFLRAP